MECLQKRRTTRQLRNREGNIVPRCQPRKLVPAQIGILLEPHNVCVAECDLIDILQRIACDEQGHQSEVYSSKELLDCVVLIQWSLSYESIYSTVIGFNVYVEFGIELLVDKVSSGFLLDTRVGTWKCFLGLHGDCPFPGPHVSKGKWVMLKRRRLFIR